MTVILPISRKGNPNLDSEKSHAFNLSYSNFTQKFNVNLSLRYSFTNNSIEQISEMVPDTEIEGLKETTGKEVLLLHLSEHRKNQECES